MTAPTTGRRYKVTVPSFDDYAEYHWTQTSLDGKRVTVIETGLTLDHNTPAVRVQWGKVRWDAPAHITLTPEQRTQLGIEHDSNAVYTMYGDVMVTEPDDPAGFFGDVVEIPRTNEYVIPTSWLLGDKATS